MTHRPRYVDHDVAQLLQQPRDSFHEIRRLQQTFSLRAEVAEELTQTRNAVLLLLQRVHDQRLCVV